jgi:hypothetical protein
MLVLFVLTVLAFDMAHGLPMMRTAPIECPLEDGNLLDVVLFSKDIAECRQLCQDNEDCIFYHYYKGSSMDRKEATDGGEKVEKKPSQCFLYDMCTREVLPATEDCPLTK